jgi:hypothetical protein
LDKTKIPTKQYTIERRHAVTLGDALRPNSGQLPEPGPLWTYPDLVDG